MSRWRTFVLIFLPLTLLVPVAVFLSYVTYREGVRQMVSERDERAVRTAAAAIEEQLNQRTLVLGNLASQLAMTPNFDQILSDDRFLAAQFDGGIAVFDAYGRPLALQGVDAESAADWPNRISPPANFSEVVWDTLAGDPLLLMTAPMSNNAYQIIGAVRPEPLIAQVLSGVLIEDEPLAAFVAGADGEHLFSIGYPSQTAETICTQMALAGDSGIRFEGNRWWGQNDTVIAFSPIEPVGWALVTEEPLSAVVDVRFNTVFAIPLALVPILLVALGAIWVGERQIVTPLHQLEKQATAVGQGDFEAIDSSVGGIDAIRSLQREMQRMSEKVATAQLNLRHHVNLITLGQEEERRRLARELHDDTIQSLIALNQRIQLAQMNSGDGVSKELGTMQALVADMIANMRRFTRALRPIGLEELGLIPALDLTIRTVAAEQELPIEFVQTGKPRRLAPEVEVAFYRITQEALNNVIKHAHATEAVVSLAFGSQAITLTIADDGEGFEIPHSPAEMARVGHFGLLGIAERAELLGAELTLSASQAEGTTLRVRLPLALAERPLPTDSAQTNAEGES